MVKELREKAGFTQEQLAEKCGVGRTTITLIELGINKPSVDLAKKLGEVFKVPWSNFFE